MTKQEKVGTSPFPLLDLFYSPFKIAIYNKVCEHKSCLSLSYQKLKSDFFLLFLHFFFLFVCYFNLFLYLCNRNKETTNFTNIEKDDFRKERE